MWRVKGGGKDYICVFQHHGGLGGRERLGVKGEDSILLRICTAYIPLSSAPIPKNIQWVYALIPTKTLP